MSSERLRELDLRNVGVDWREREKFSNEGRRQERIFEVNLLFENVLKNN